MPSFFSLLIRKLDLLLVLFAFQFLGSTHALDNDNDDQHADDWDTSHIVGIVLSCILLVIIVVGLVLRRRRIDREGAGGAFVMRSRRGGGLAPSDPSRPPAYPPPAVVPGYGPASYYPPPPIAPGPGPYAGPPSIAPEYAEDPTLMYTVGKEPV
ncbi:hypothetical protein DFH07DRAFT_1007848 [Mycena maculata]|uniref:Transmembrane protein n=1 Tax=Mycena maculata TaxID=230809 RepID=A0AAD7JPL6_9AGAR|nr:hypothetical protein DFH07DRAFT_1007848 [Mycena maculata]